MAAGWNGMMSHHTPHNRRVLSGISEDPDKLLAVIDRRSSETMKIADIHLVMQPGTDVLLSNAMIAIFLREVIQDREYIDRRASGFEKILP